MKYIRENKNEDKKTGILLTKPTKDIAVKKVLQFSIHVVEFFVRYGLKYVITDRIAEQVLDFYKMFLVAYENNPHKLLDAMTETLKANFKEIADNADKDYLDRLCKNYKVAVRELTYSKNLEELVHDKLDELINIAIQKNDEIGKFMFSTIKSYAVIQYNRKVLIRSMILAIATIIVSYLVLAEMTHEKHPIKLIKKVKELIKLSSRINMAKRLVLLFAYVDLLLALILLIRAAYRYAKTFDQEKYLYKTLENV